MLRMLLLVTSWNGRKSRARKRQPPLPALCFWFVKRILKKAAYLRWALTKLDSGTRGSFSW